MAIDRIYPISGQVGARYGEITNSIGINLVSIERNEAQTNRQKYNEQRSGNGPLSLSELRIK